MELVVTLALRLSCVRSSGKTTPAALYSPINVEMQLKKQVLQKPVISSPLSHVDVSNYISFASCIMVVVCTEVDFRGAVGSQSIAIL